MSDAILLSGISGLSFDSPFLSPLLFCCLVLLHLLACHFLLMVHSSDLFPKKALKYFSLMVKPVLNWANVSSRT